MDKFERPLEKLPYTPQIRRGENVLPAYDRSADARRVAHTTARAFQQDAGWLQLVAAEPKEDSGGERFIPRLQSAHPLFKDAEILVWLSPDNKIVHATIETLRKTMNVDAAGRISEERYKTT